MIKLKFRDLTKIDLAEFYWEYYWEYYYSNKITVFNGDVRLINFHFKNIFVNIFKKSVKK